MNSTNQGHVIVNVDAKSLRAITRNCLKGQWKKVGLVSLIFLVATTAPTIGSEMLTFNYNLGAESAIPFGMFASFAVSMFAVPFSILFYFFVICPITYGASNYFLKVSRREEYQPADILIGYKNLSRSIGIVFLTTLFIFLWTLLFVIPGIVAAYRYSLAFYISLDNPEKSAMDCINESKQLMRGNKGAMFFLDLTFIGWICLTTLVGVIGSSVVSAGFAIGYFNIFLSLIGTLPGVAIILVSVAGSAAVCCYMAIANIQMYRIIKSELANVQEEYAKYSN